MVKKFAVALIVVLVLAAAGYKFGLKYVSEAVINKVANEVLTGEEIDKLVQDPQVKKILEERLGTEAFGELLKRQPGAGAGAAPGTGQGTGLGPQSGAATGNGNGPEGGSGTGTGTGAGSITGNQNVPGTGNNSKPSEGKGKGGGLVFNTAEEALQFLLTKFSRAELNGFIAMAEDGITPEEKSQVKAALLSRLTAEEYQALKVIALIELEKRQHNLNIK
ncbi:MAG TPA: hypothetical protein GXZ25_06190 [Peptococcaceae bacterium]|jgi:hypothetical protein|uniref:Uncharacterized protein n=1 Tax=anaerobic digester metagenome TaxID=1263854 RepID=A0A485M586_9ZZZZ|nr:hypothetical protein [Bacillota bacterium]HHU86383.1 hypothetical protein [Peptococcaceae bacterium]